MTNFVWRGHSAAWSDAGAWLQPGAPGNPSDTAAIDAAGAYTSTVELSKSYALNTLTLNDADGTLDVVGRLNFTGAQHLLTLTAGTLQLDATGVIADATIVPGAFTFVANGGTFVRDTYEGPLSLRSAGSLVATGGLTVTGASAGAPGVLTLDGTSTLTVSGGLTVGTVSNLGSIDIIGDAAALAFADSETLDNATITLDGFSAGLIDASGTLTLGAHVTVEATSSFGTIAGNVINQGLLSQTAGLLIVQAGSAAAVFDNQGTLTIASAGFFVGVSQFLNSGSVDIAAGGILTIGAATTLVNAGQLTVESGAILELDDDLTLSQLLAFGITNNGGTVAFGGTLDLQGATLDLAATGLLQNVSLIGGAIRNGTIKADGGALTSSSGTLANVTHRGTFDLAAYSTFDTVGTFKVTQTSGTGPGTIVFGDSSTLTIGNSLVLGTGTALGAIELSGAGAELAFATSGTLQHASLLIDGLDASLIASTGILTLASDVVTTVTGDTTSLIGQIINLGNIVYENVSGFIDDASAGDIFTNEGSITLSFAALNVNTDQFVNTGRIAIGSFSVLSVGANTVLSNTGQITIASAGTLSFQGPTTLAGLKADGVTNNGGVLQIGGNLDLQGGTLDLATSGLFSDVDLGPSGTISNGTILPDGGALQLGGGTLSGITYRGPFTVMNFSALGVQSGLTVTGANGVGPGIVTLGANTSLNLSGGLQVGSLGQVGALNVLSDGTTIDFLDSETLDHVVIDIAGGSTQIYADGGTVVTFGSDATVDLTTMAGTLFGGVVNSGSIDVTNGVFSFEDFQSGDGFDNRGSIVVVGATLNLDEDTIQNEGRITVGSGGVVTTGPFSTFESTGQVILGDGSQFEVSNSTVASFTYAGRGLLILDDPFGFTGALDNLTAGSALRLTDTVVDSASIAGTTLTIHLQGGTSLSYQTTAGSFTGALTVTADPNGTLDTIVLPCFLSGTRLLTDRGEVAVEALREHDGVVTLSGRVRPVRWIGVRRLDCRLHPHPEAILPVRIRAGAFGPGLPTRDLFVSPDHAIYAEGVLIPVKHLVNGSTLARVRPAFICYHHVELDSHDIIFADGLATESYLDTGEPNRLLQWRRADDAASGVRAGRCGSHAGVGRTRLRAFGGRRPEGRPDQGDAGPQRRTIGERRRDLAGRCWLEPTIDPQFGAWLPRQPNDRGPRDVDCRTATHRGHDGKRVPEHDARSGTWPLQPGEHRLEPSQVRGCIRIDRAEQPKHRQAREGRIDPRRLRVDGQQRGNPPEHVR